MNKFKETHCRKKKSDIWILITIEERESTGKKERRKKNIERKFFFYRIAAEIRWIHETRLGKKG